jgi:hypothetical protein
MSTPFSGFLGQNNYVDALELPIQVGVASANQRPGFGDLRPWRAALPVAFTPVSGRKTIYRMGVDIISDTIYWLSWPTVVHAIRGFEKDDTTERTYYTGDGAPKWTDNTIGLAGGVLPSAFRSLGVPAPISAPLVTLTTGVVTVLAEDWTYVHTFVASNGWESGPSPASATITSDPGGTVTLSSLEAPPGGYNIDRRRIYKTFTTAAGVTALVFLREIAVGLGSTIDDARAVNTKAVLTTGDWLPPPADGKCLALMWNGMAGMLSGKALCICVPEFIYAWPILYQTKVPDTPMGFVVFGQNGLILTNGDVYMVNGADPLSCNAEPLKIFQPLASPTGYVAFPNGAAWASPNGCWWYGSGGEQNLTAGVFSKEQWQALNPASMILQRYLGYLFIFYQYSGTDWRGLVIDIGGAQAAVYPLDKGFSAVFRDGITGELYVLDATGPGTSIQRFNAHSALLTAKFTSKPVRESKPINMAVYQVVARNYPVNVSWYADGVLRFTDSVTSDRPVRFDQGYEATEMQLHVETSVGSVQMVRMAVSMGDLKQT